MCEPVVISQQLPTSHYSNENTYQKNPLTSTIHCYFIQSEDDNKAHKSTMGDASGVTFLILLELVPV